MRGRLYDYFAADHRRLDDLLRRAVARAGPVDLDLYGAFRAGLLRHVGMEEKALFPALRAVKKGEPPAIMARLRVDHGALAALLVPAPTRAIVADVLSVLVPHNLREEELGGIYDAADTALGPAAAERLLSELRQFPEPPLKPYNDSPEVFRHVQATLAQARRQWTRPGGR